MESDGENEISVTVGEEAVRKWASAKKLSQKTTDALITIGYDSMEALSLLTKDDLLDSNIPIGQRNLLLHCIKNTFPLGPAAGSKPQHQPREHDNTQSSSAPGPSATDRSSSAPDQALMCDQSSDSFIRNVLGQLSSAQQPGHQPTSYGGSSAHAMENTGTFSWQDPQIYLKSLSNSVSNSNYLDITEFANMSANLQTERILSNNDDGQLIFKSGPSKPKLESLSISQWSVANLAILQKLLQDNCLTQGQILDYLSYTTRVYQLFSTHEVKSVYFYDREYRKLQHQHKFRWGTDIPHIQTVFLRPKIASPPQYAQQAKQNSRPNLGFPHQPRASHTSQGVEICRRFNSKRSCTVKQCKYAHTCSVPGCSDKHPASEHASSKNM
ncbi:uncharacterized protein LOC134232131 [Saccostrea cucullata]|uniref:uncharacterized protein LOC134232131 n=1 Tax=Saccostrea cuccullata TaxID=36930 RepID=UPI002ED2C585